MIILMNNYNINDDKQSSRKIYLNSIVFTKKYNKYKYIEMLFKYIMVFYLVEIKQN